MENRGNGYLLPVKGGAMRLSGFRNVSLPVLLILLVLLVVPVSADNWVGGLPLTTVQTGTVSGDLWFDAIPPTFATSVTKDFTLPAAAVGSNVQWARLYVSTYTGHMQNNLHGSITTRWDNNKDGSNEASWNEDLNVPFVYIVNGGNDNTVQGGGSGDPYKMVNNHCNRVTSDYVMWYDVKSLLTTQNIRVSAVASPVSSSFDGRIKMVTLVVAYNDGDTDQVRYWVNQGHDSCSYYTEDNYGEVAVGSTTFDTSGPGSISSATLTSAYIASNNGYYGFPTDENTFDAATKTGSFTNGELDRTPDTQGSYSGVKSWDITPSITGSSEVTLGYARYLPGTGTAAFFKIPLTFLKVRYGTAPPMPPVANFAATPLSGPAPFTVLFSDTSTNNPNSWTWYYRLGSGSWTQFSTAQNPSYTFTTVGTYGIRLVAANSAGSTTNTKSSYITVNAATLPPIAAFSAAPTTGTAPLTVTFTDQSTNTPTSWKWESKSATSVWTQFATIRNPSFSFSSSGIFDIRLTATNAAGADNETKTGYITVNNPPSAPVAAFGATPTSGTAPLVVLFTDQSTGTITSRTWDFDNDGTIDSTAQNPSHSYSTPGSFTVNLTVTGPGGSDSERKTGYITVLPAPPVAAFTATPRSGSPPLTVTFTDQSTNSPTSWKWEYKNATVDWISFATTRNPSYTFVTGVYDIRLNTTNNGGNDAETKTGYITVNTTPIPPVADFSANRTAGSVPLTIRFSDISTGMITGWAWDCNGDGRIDSIAQDPIYTYTAPGSYTINLTVSGPGGTDFTVKTGYITATSAAPIAAFTATPKSGRPPLAVLFSDTSTGSITSYVWDFTSDGTIDSTTKNATYTYTNTGTYTVNLTVTGPGGSLEHYGYDYC